MAAPTRELSASSVNHHDDDDHHHHQLTLPAQASQWAT
jgi:hypothetical protein